MGRKKMMTALLMLTTSGCSVMSEHPALTAVAAAVVVGLAAGSGDGQRYATDVKQTPTTPTCGVAAPSCY